MPLYTISLIFKFLRPVSICGVLDYLIKRIITYLLLKCIFFSQIGKYSLLSVKRGMYCELVTVIVSAFTSNHVTPIDQ